MEGRAGRGGQAGVSESGARPCVLRGLCSFGVHGAGPEGRAGGGASKGGRVKSTGQEGEEEEEEARLHSAVGVVVVSSPLV